MPAGALWNSQFQGDQVNIRKVLYGSALVRDYNVSSTSLTGFTPFNSSDGNLITTMFSSTNPGGAWLDPGYLSEAGPDFNPKLTTELTKVMQTRRPARADYTEDSEEITVTYMESNPVTDALTQNKPLASGLQTLGSTNYAVGRPVELDIIRRQLMFIGVDNTSANAFYIVRVYPCVVVTSIGKRSWNAKKPDSVEVKFQSFDDPWTISPDGVAGAPVIIYRDGPAWRAAGGPTLWPGNQTAPVATAVAGKQATVAFGVPVSPNSPFTYQVLQTTGGVQSLATLSGVPTGTTTITATVINLTVGANYTFNVIATGTNGQPSVPSLTSNSITAIS